MQLCALIYDYVDGMTERRTPYRDDHLALIERYSEAGSLVLAGALGDPPGGGLLVFTDDAAATEFVGEDPYRAAGLIAGSRIEPWNVVSRRPLPD